MIKTKMVDEVKNSYTYYLENKLNKIYYMSKCRDVSLEIMKKNIRNYIWDATYSYTHNGKTMYTKKKWFLETMDEIDSKKDLFFFCQNSIRKAQQTLAH